MQRVYNILLNLSQPERNLVLNNFIRQCSIIFKGRFCFHWIFCKLPNAFFPLYVFKWLSNKFNKVISLLSFTFPLDSAKSEIFKSILTLTFRQPITNLDHSTLLPSTIQFSQFSYMRQLERVCRTCMEKYQFTLQAKDKTRSKLR